MLLKLCNGCPEDLEETLLPKIQRAYQSIEGKSEVDTSVTHDATEILHNACQTLAHCSFDNWMKCAGSSDAESSVADFS